MGTLRTSVEVMGFEPTASSMRPKRSSQLSYTPEGPRRIADALSRPNFGASVAGSATFASNIRAGLAPEGEGERGSAAGAAEEEGRLGGAGLAAGEVADLEVPL